MLWGIAHCNCVASWGHLSCCEALLTVTVCDQSGAPVMLWGIAHCNCVASRGHLSCCESLLTVTLCVARSHCSTPGRQSGAPVMLWGIAESRCHSIAARHDVPVHSAPSCWSVLLSLSWLVIPTSMFVSAYLYTCDIIVGLHVPVFTTI